MSELMLETNCLTKAFGKHKAVNELNIHVKKGAVYGLIGRNGAGKTTFMKVATGLASQTSGELTIMGCTGAELKKVRNRVGCLIENPGLYPNFSAYDNLKLKCIASGVNKTGYIDELLELVGLTSAKKKKTKKFSLGMKQRLGIALALVGEPDLLVLDEPINGLDPQGIAEVRETIQRLNTQRNMTIIISSHILGELSKIATDYGIIHNGELIKELSSQELNDLCSQKIEITLNDPKSALPVLDKMGIKNYSVTDNEHISIFERINESAKINAGLVSSGIEVSQICICGEELEQYYLNLTGGQPNV